MNLKGISGPLAHPGTPGNFDYLETIWKLFGNFLETCWGYLFFSETISQNNLETILKDFYNNFDQFLKKQPLQGYRTHKSSSSTDLI